MILGDLVTLKSLLEIPDCVTTEDRRLLIFLQWATEWVEELCDRKFGYGQYTEYIDAKGTQRLLLRHRPARPSGMQVWLDSASNFNAGDDPFPDTSLLTYGTDYILEIDDVAKNWSKRGILYRINATWARRWTRSGPYLSAFHLDNPGTVKVTYNAGYAVDEMPANVRGAVLTLVAKMRNYFPLAMEIGGEGYEDRSLSYNLTDRNYLLTSVKDMLVNHRNWSF